MLDRIPSNPGRVLITPEDGSTPYHATMSRADNPTQEGTPLNKGTLLKDSTARLYNLGTEGTPDEVFRRIAEGKASNPNLLDNWYFADPIDQRGGTIDAIPPGTAYYPLNSTAQVGTTDRYYPALSDPNNWQIEINGTRYWVYRNTSVKVRGYTGGGYGIDRWLTSQGAILLTENGINIKKANSPYGYAWLEQRLEKMGSLMNQQVTLSVLTSAGLTKSTASLIEGFDYNPYTFVGPNGSYCRAFFMDSDTICVNFIGVSDNDPDIIAVKLELGSVQTLAHQDANGNWVLNDPPPDKGVEALKCATSTADSTDTFANMGAGATKTITATLSTSWTASGNYFYQDVTANGILATDNPVVGVNPGSDNAANVNYSMAFSNVFRVTTSANSIRVWARSKPTVAIPIQIKVVR